jgi:DNA-binding MarR family transcriptional regulator
MSAASVRAVLEALELFRDLDGSMSLNSVVAFLAVSQREGLTMKELAFLTRMSDVTASRSIRALEAPEASTALRPALGLVSIARSAVDSRQRLIHLTEDGRRLRDQITAHIQLNTCTSVSI